MSNDSPIDPVKILDRGGRRRFLRQSSVLAAVIGASASIGSRSALAADCDRGGPGGEKPEHAGNGSDSDRGANADPTGCGRRHEDTPKISQANPSEQNERVKSVSVAKIIG